MFKKQRGWLSNTTEGRTPTSRPGVCGFAWPGARLGSRLRLTAAVGEAAVVKKVTVRVLDEAIARGKTNK